MRKFKLDLDALVVDSFATGAEGDKGTVNGHEYTEGCSVDYCNSAEGTCAILSCAQSACYGGANTECACAQSQYGSCYYQNTCNGGQCAGSAWCQYHTMGASCQSCINAGCDYDYNTVGNDNGC